MDLIERDGFMDMLRSKFKDLASGEGHCVFVSGEAGIGKTSLVKTFCKELKAECNIYQGGCDALFTPRPLAPLYDIMWQVNSNLWPTSHSIEDRSELFTRFFRELKNQKEKTLLVFEDIHWADEATLDFIKFLGRRISQLPCLFILTYRDNEIHLQHPLRNVLGQLPPDSFTRLQLTPLSKEAVKKLSDERGYSGEDVYSISGGNPFYVNEILASYSLGVPDNIKNSILSAYDQQEEKTKQVWELLSVIPAGFEIKYLEKFEPLYALALDRCIESNILLINDGRIYFKHELFRRTIESFLSPLKRVSLNKKILELLLDSLEQNQEIERIVHHAKNANEYELVVKYAPLAAKEAASVGAHTEASKLYLTAIEYYQGNDKDLLIRLYESYAYECYLTNQIKEAIIYTGKSLDIWKEKNDTEQTGNCMRFLSRLWWLDGNRKKAESFGEQAIEALNNMPSSRIKAMALSNMSHLKMLFDEADECIKWGEKAVTIAREQADEETLSHALNNVGAVQMLIKSSQNKGIELLRQSLDIALKNSYHEHAARAYTNLGSITIKIKDYASAKKILEEGIKYCEERDLDSWTLYLLTLRAKLHFETGNWDEAYRIAEKLIKYENRSIAVTISVLIMIATIKMRRSSEDDPLPLLLEAKTKAFGIMEMQRIIPSLIALLEYEWLTGKIVIEKKDIDRTMANIGQTINNIENNEFAFWLQKVRKLHLPVEEVYEGYEINSVTKAHNAAALWAKSGCPYQEALCLFAGKDDDKRKAITLVHELGANAVYEKMKSEMRGFGIKNIPRGIRKTTQSNPALLTQRELDVLQLLNEGLQNKEIAARLFISAKTVDHHISSILYKLEVNSRTKAVHEAIRLEIIK
jgi:DNA-binding CsgD family transcriptional regulator/Tfp pilus assembly protein PilF